MIIVITMKLFLFLKKDLQQKQDSLGIGSLYARLCNLLVTAMLALAFSMKRN